MSVDCFIDDKTFSVYDLLNEHDVSTKSGQITVKRGQKQQKTTRQRIAKAAANAKRRVRHNWKESEETQLIQSVYKQRPLYDCVDPRYKINFVKSKCWKDVANELGIPGVDSQEARNKWNGLRNNFKMYMARFRSRKSEQGTDEINVDSVKWPHFKSMIFVESADVVQTISTTSTLILAKNGTDQTISDYILPDSIQAITPKPTVAQRRKGTASKATTVPSTPPSSPTLSPWPTPSSSPTPSSENIEERAVQVLGKLEKRAQAVPNRYTTFTDNIARHMQSLDEDSAFELETLLTRNVLDFVAANRLKLKTARSEY